MARRGGALQCVCVRGTRGKLRRKIAPSVPCRALHGHFARRCRRRRHKLGGCASDAATGRPTPEAGPRKGQIEGGEVGAGQQWWIGAHAWAPWQCAEAMASTGTVSNAYRTKRPLGNALAWAQHARCAALRGARGLGRLVERAGKSRSELVSGSKRLTGRRRGVRFTVTGRSHPVAGVAAGVDKVRLLGAGGGLHVVLPAAGGFGRFWAVSGCRERGTFRRVPMGERRSCFGAGGRRHQAMPRARKGRTQAPNRGPPPDSASDPLPAALPAPLRAALPPPHLVSGMDMRIDSMRPPVFRPKMVPRS